VDDGRQPGPHSMPVLDREQRHREIIVQRPEGPRLTDQPRVHRTW
jgi:hypothetical protein